MRARSLIDPTIAKVDGTIVNDASLLKGKEFLIAAMRRNESVVGPVLHGFLRPWVFIVGHDSLLCYECGSNRFKINNIPIPLQ
jgi:hypothetical protein